MPLEDVLAKDSSYLQNHIQILVVGRNDKLTESDTKRIINTARHLRKIKALKNIPVHGLVLDDLSGIIRVIDQAESKDKKSVAKSDVIPEAIPFELPDIILPDIPTSDLDKIMAPEKKSFKYGKSTKSQQTTAAPDYDNRLSLSKMKELSTVDMPAFNNLSSNDIKLEQKLSSGLTDIKLPAPVKIQNTGITKIKMPTNSAEKRRQHQKISTKKQTGHESIKEFTLEPELHLALQKLRSFLLKEFNQSQRHDLIKNIQQTANYGKPFGEVLKVLIGPILKLGEKRYAVVNELIKVKEELPKIDLDIAMNILLDLIDD
jgi:hypothetical protein